MLCHLWSFLCRPIFVIDVLSTYNYIQNMSCTRLCKVFHCFLEFYTPAMLHDTLRNLRCSICSILLSGLITVLYCAPPGSRIHWIPWIPWNSMDIHRLRKCNFKKIQSWFLSLWMFTESCGIHWTSINTELKLTLLSLQYSSRYSHK